MKLASKLVLVLVLVVVSLLAIEGVIGVRREDELFETDMERSLLVMGHTLAATISDAWQEGGAERALTVIDHANQVGGPVRIGWTRRGTPPSEDDAPHANEAQLRGVWERGSPASVVNDWGDGSRWLLIYVPLRVDGVVHGAIELRRSLNAADRHAKTAIVRTVLLTGAIGLAAALIISILGVRWVGRPLRLLAAKAKQVGEGELDGELELHTRDELEMLASELNAMSHNLAEARRAIREETSARIQAIEQLRHADRLTTVGRLAAGVAHELGTPLNVVSGHAGLLLRGESSSEEAAASAATIKEQTALMTTIIKRLLAFARRRPLKKERADVGDIVARGVQLMEPLIKKRSGTIEFSRSGEDLHALVDHTQLEQVVSNLVMNAMQSKPEMVNVEVRIDVDHAPSPPPEATACEAAIRIDVSDDGQGIAPDDIDHVFEPFFTTKDVGEGTGLGLSIAHGLVREHGGWMQVESTLGEGCCFSVFLPKELEA